NTMSWLQLARLVQSSVAVQVRRKTRTTGHVAGSSSSTNVIVRLVSQLSLAVGSPKIGTAPNTHSLVRFGWQVMIGGIVSLTVMICTHEAALVQSSITVCVRAIVPPQIPPTSDPSVQ